MALTEHETRGQLIDRQLEQAGWRMDDHTQIRREIPADSAAVHGAPPPYGSGKSAGITDLCLYDEDGCVLAVIECKRTSRNAREGEEQLRLYITHIGKQQPFIPFGFMANGHQTWFWEVGLAHPRAMAGFTTRADLKRLRFIRQNHKPLALETINRSIVDRPYQHEANDIPDLLECWNHRQDVKFQKKRDARLAELLKQIAPLKKERLAHHALIHRLRFESAISPPITPMDTDSGNLRKSVKSPDKSPVALLSSAESELTLLNQRITPCRTRSTSLPASSGLKRSRWSPRITIYPPAATVRLSRTRFSMRSRK